MDLKLSIEFVEMVDKKRTYLIIKNNEDDTYQTVFTGQEAEDYGKQISDLIKGICMNY